MKKLLFTLLFAAATLPGWADDNFYLLGNATPIGWIGTDESDRTPTKMQPTGNANEYAWTGLLKTVDNGFKICKNNTWNGYKATSDQEVLVYDVDISTQDNNDYKWKVTETNYCLVTLNTSTAKIKVHRLVPAKDDGTCLIGTESHLTEFRKLVNNKGMTNLNAKLTADITLTGNHTPIGTSTNKYAGTFDGQGHKIENLSISSDQSGVGFFGQTNGATIQKVEFLKAKVNITITDNSTAQNTGIIVGNCDGGSISECAVVNSYISGRDHTGSIAGNAQNCTISNCYSNAKVSSLYQVGGMVGTMNGDLTLEKCLFMGPSIEATGSTGTVAGLISRLEGGTLTLKNNFVAAQYVLAASAANSATEYNSYCKALLADHADLDYLESFSSGENNYSLKTTRYGKISNTYEFGLTKPSDKNGGQKNPSDVNLTFFSSTLGFNFSDTWKMVENLTYAGGSFPVLKWMTAPAASVEISTAQELYDFSTFMWDNQNVTLTSDIDYTASAYQGQDAMIGTPYSRVYAGTFDGQNHTITVGFNNTNAENSALFCQVNGGTIKNLKVAGNITTDKKFAGGICANVNRKATITNCESNVTIKDSRTTDVDGTHGGIVALVSSHSDGVEISNCLFSGAISASTADGCGGVVGWTSGGSSNVAIKNCLITGTMTVRTTNNGVNDIIARNGANESNNYYVGSFTGISNAESAVQATDEQETSGKLCYLLNGSTQGGTNWTQTIGTDNYPVPFNTQRLVYLNNSTTYANNYIKDGKYQISNASELVDFSALVNDGNASLDAELTADIDMSSVTGWTPIGQHLKDYAGHFNGQGHRIKNLKIDNGYENQALLGQAIHPAIIENVIIDSSCSIKGKKWAAGILGHVWGDGVIIRNCGNEANITGTENTCAGILGCSDGKIVQIYNCYNTGDISSPTWNAGICGWMGNTNSIIKNCYSIGSVSGTESAPIWRYNDGLNTGNEENIWTTSDGQGSKITGTMLTDGELCYKLGAAFTQKLGEDGDSHPVFNSKQVILNGNYENVAPTLALDDANSFGTNSDFDVTSVTMTRTLKGEKWNTFCVPFDMEVSELGTGAEVKELTGATLNGNNYSMTFGNASTIEAGKAYMVRVPSDVTSLSLSNKTIKSTITPTTKDGVTFTGVYTNGKAPQGSFIISNNVFYNVDSDVTLKAFRGYITTSGNNVKALTFDFDDDATGIKTLSDSPLKGENIYNLAGQRLLKAQKGINIVNGKKILK